MVILKNREKGKKKLVCVSYVKFVFIKTFIYCTQPLCLLLRPLDTVYRFSADSARPDQSQTDMERLKNVFQV